MAAEPIKIDVVIDTVDNTDPELENITKNLKHMKTAADNANSSVKKAGETVTKFDKSAQKTQKSLTAWAKEKYEILLEAKDKISPVLSSIGRGLRGFTGKTWSVTMKAVDFATAPIRGIINLLKNPVFQVGAVLGVSISLKDTVDTYADFESTMSRVQALSNANVPQMEQLTAKAKEMGAQTKFSGRESAEAFTYMAQAGWQVQDMIDGIGGIMSLAAADGLDLATTTDIVSNALTAFNMKAKDTAEFADVLAVASGAANTNVSELGEAFKYIAPVAGAMGYSIQDTSLALGLMSNNAVKGSMAGTSLKTSLANMAAPTDAIATAMKKYGISLTDAEGNMKTLKGVMDNLRGSLGGLSEVEQTAAASTIFGKDAMAGMLAIINTSEEDYKKLTEAIGESEGAADRMAVTMQDNLKGSLEELGGSIETVQLSWGEKIKPYIIDLSNMLQEKMPEIEEFGLNLFNSLERKIESVQDKIAEFTSTEEWANADVFGKISIAWDELIIEPFSEWWSTTGKTKMNVLAGDIGNAIGTGLTVGVAGILGIDVSETIDEGNALGASFAKGFSEGFDFDVISERLWNGLGSVIGKAAKLLPGGESADLSSLLSAGLLFKIGSPLFKMGKGAFRMGKGLFGAGKGGVSFVTSMLGSTGNAMVRGSGLLGKFADVGYALAPVNKAGMYFGNMAGTMSGGMAALSGAGTMVGGAMGGATLVSAGMDAYKAITSSDKEEQKAYGTSAGLKAGGVAAGAAIGTLILPGVGSLIGAGIGGLAGWLAGDKVKEDYHEDVEEMEKEAERVQRIYDITGLSVEQVRFANEDLNKALKDTNLSAEELANLIQEDMAKVAKEAFGDIHLSLEEIKELSEEITFGKSIEGVTEFAKASDTASGTFAALKNAVSSLKKENWKASLGMNLDETERDGYKQAIDDFVESANQYIQDSHYQATVALNLITEGKGSTTGLDALYANMESQISSISGKLSEKVTIALQDGVIDLSEQKEIVSLQQQTEDITNKISTAQTDASLDVLKVKYGNGALLDVESFYAMQEELKSQIQTWTENYDTAYELTLTNLKLQLSEGAITQEEYDKAYKEATDGYTAQMQEMYVRVQKFNLESIAGAWEEQLNGILPDMEGSLSEKLATVMNNALLEKPDVSAWTEEDIAEWFDLDGIDYSVIRNFYKEIKEVAAMAPQGVKNEIMKSYKDSVPTAEEIKAAIDWDSLTNMDWRELMESITGPREGESMGLSSEDLKKKMSDYYGDSFESVIESYSEAIHNALEQSNSSETLNTFMEEYMSKPMSDLESMDSDWEKSGIMLGTALNTGVVNSLSGRSSLWRTQIQTELSNSVATPFAVTPTVNVTPKYNTNGLTSLPGLSGSVLQGAIGATRIVAKKHAAGGYVSGGPQLSWLAEEGYGEFVIPTNPSRRSRALELYEQAGAALGVTTHAEGGYVGGSNSASNVTSYHLFNEAVKNAPEGNNKDTGDNIKDNSTVYEPVSAFPEQSSSNNQISVNVSVSPKFVIDGSGAKSEEDIMAIIRKNMKSVADELGGEMAERLQKVFSNMPTVKEA